MTTWLHDTSASPIDIHTRGDGAVPTNPSTNAARTNARASNMPSRDLSTDTELDNQRTAGRASATISLDHDIRHQNVRAGLRRLVAAISVAALVTAVLPAFAVELDALVLGTVLALSFATAGAWTDARTGLIPDELVIATGATATITAAAADQVTALAIGAAIVGLPLLVLHIVNPSAMGFGDVKLGLALGGTIGVIEPRLGVVALACASACAVVTGLVTKRQAIPFGPALAAGGVFVAVGAAPLIRLLTGGPSPWQ